MMSPVLAFSSARQQLRGAIRKLEGTMPLADAGMHAFGQHVDAQRADEIAAQRRRAPELVVVAAFGVEAHDEARLADAVAERLMCGQVDAAALFAGLDQHDAAGVRDLLRVQRADRRERAEHRVAVVGAAAAVELAVADHGLPRPEARAASR